MNIKEVIANAVKAEQESYELYTAGAGKTSSKAGKELFTKLAKEELKHKKILQELDFSKLDKFKGKIEKLNFVDELASTPLNELQVLKDIMEFAIKKEIRSQEFYAKLAVSTEGKIKELFEKLVGEEKKHEAWVRSEYNKIFS